MSSHESSNAKRFMRAFTLTELLVASALALVVMGAVAALFAILGRSVRNSQATVEMTARMRAATWLLRQDLVGVTCPVAPTLGPDENAGYFELLEGPLRDTTFALDGQGPTTNLSADTDDILLFTTQSLARPFMGRYGGTMIESPFAEVAWFCRPSANQPVAGMTLYDLHRRQLLVIAYLGQASGTTNSLPLNTDRVSYDLSLRRATLDGLGTLLVPNSLGDLTKREHRFLRDGYSFLTSGSQTRSVSPQAFPFAFPTVSTTVSTGTALMLARPEAGLDDTPRAWEDIVLLNVVSFDVRVFDPQARPQQAGDAWLLPGDPAYATPPVGSGTASGAYVDLGFAGGSPVLASGTFPPAGTTALQSAGVRVAGTTSLPQPTFDTWSRHYEFNAVDDDADGVVDEGSAGVDVNADGYPDDLAQTETSPPYPVPLRGVEVRIRCYEPSSKQVRQTTLRHSFPR
jgi:hypothetical protein